MFLFSVSPNPECLAMLKRSPSFGSISINSGQCRRTRSPLRYILSGDASSRSPGWPAPLLTEKHTSYVLGGDGLRVANWPEPLLRAESRTNPLPETQKTGVVNIQYYTVGCPGWHWIKLTQWSITQCVSNALAGIEIDKWMVLMLIILNVMANWVWIMLTFLMSNSPNYTSSHRWYIK